LSTINYKDRITNVLEVEKVAYQVEIARRIDILKDRTIKFVIKEMVSDGEIEESDFQRVDGRLKVKYYWKYLF